MAKLPPEARAKLLSINGVFDARLNEVFSLQVPPQETRGRPDKWAWKRAVLAVLAQISRGKIPYPQCLSDVERALSTWFDNEYLSEPAEGQIRDHARLIWAEVVRGLK